MDTPEPTAFVLIITGTVGVGKSSAANEVFEVLQRASEPVALINLDEFGYVSPRPTNDPYNKAIRLKNLAAVWQNYAKLGTTRVIIPTVIENADDLEACKQAIPNAQFLVVRLEASPNVVAERIKGRALGGDEAWHLKRAPELAEILNNNQVEDLVINTDGKTIPAIASEVLTKWRR